MIKKLTLIALSLMATFAGMAQDGKLSRYQVKVGDIIEVTFGSRTTKYEVLEIRESATIEQAAGMIRPLGLDGHSRRNGV